MSNSSTNRGMEGRRSDDAGRGNDSNPSPSSNEPTGSFPVVGCTEERRMKSKFLAGATDPRAVSVAPRGGVPLPSSSERKALAKKKKKKTVRIPLTIEVEETPSLYERMKRSEGPFVDPSLRTTQKRPREDDEESKGDEDRIPLSDKHSPERKLLRASEGTVPVPNLNQKMISTDSDLLSSCSIPKTHEGQPSTTGEQMQVPQRGEATPSVPIGEITVGSAPTKAPGACSNGDGGQVGVSNKHHFSFEYRGPHPIVTDPSACEDLLGRILEVVEGIPESGLGVPRRSSGEIAATHVLVITRAHVMLCLFVRTC